MAEIIEFRRRTVDRKAVAVFGPCEVIIFPGVRIERGVFSLADRVSAESREQARIRRAHSANDE